MKRYKTLITDFDGTLAGNNGEITDEVMVGVQKLIAKGCIFSIATGRPYFGRIKKVCEEFNLVYPQITHGGAEIRTYKDDKILWAKYLQDDEVKDLIKYFSKKHIYFTIEKDNYVFTPDGKKAFYSDSFIFKKVTDVTLQNTPKIVVSSMLNKLSMAEIDVMIDELQIRYKNIHVIKGKIGEYYGFDITAEQATKHVSVLEYMKLLHLDPSEVVGVGDGYNDYPLLTACGVKVAMGDAPEELKEIADFVAPTQKEDGLLKVIEKYFS